jgi:hypothetical protein
MLERTTRLFLVSLVVVACTLAAAPDLAAALTISGTFNFRGNEGPNTLGLLVGDRLAFGANAVNPGGPPTVVQATQGTTTLALIAQSAFPPALPYARSIPFDPTLTGSWFIEAFRGADSAVAFTPSIPNPQLVPLVLNPRTSGTGFQPLVEWDLPDLTGFDVDQTRVTVFDDVLNQQVFQGAGLSPSATSWLVPGGVLQPGKQYVFLIQLFDFGQNTIENRSSTFTLTPYTVSAPHGAALLALGAGLMLWRRRRAATRTT